ncbi:MAG: succinylglutamate desuccinylase/aspartoacylase family protein [Phycisphaeraceae bacterium]|nr:succinylglutamate desuccinylase/aspartoacylase family protein [Phycisphaeraceae bacterium]
MARSESDPSQDGRDAPAQRVVAQIDGKRPGPTMLVVGALHANEPAGLAAARRVHAWLCDRRDSFAGRFVAIRGHTRAPSTARYVDEDLNRAFTRERLERRNGPPSVEQVEARELLQLVAAERRLARGPVILIDLHTTSAPSLPFVAFEDTLPVRRLARATGLPMLVGLEECLQGLFFDHLCSALGIPAMVIEGGEHQAPLSVEVLSNAVRLVMARAEMVSLSPHERVELRGADHVNTSRRAGSVFDIRFRLAVVDPALTIPLGVEAFGPVRRRRTTLAIQHGVALKSPITGVAIMPNRQAERKIGDDAVFVATRVSRVWLALSAWLRRREFIHRMLPAIAPGVSAIPGRAGALRVSPRIAVVLKREVFHLLGYRVLAGSDAAVRSAPVRWLRAAGFSLATLGRAATRPWRRTPDAPASKEEEVWIVERRRLDRAAK